MSTGPRADQTATTSLLSGARWLMFAMILFGLLATHVLGSHDTDGEHAPLPVVSVSDSTASAAANDLSSFAAAAVTEIDTPQATLAVGTVPATDIDWHLTALECAVVLMLLGALIMAVGITGHAVRSRAPGRTPADSSPAWASAMTGALAARFALCVARV